MRRHLETTWMPADCERFADLQFTNGRIVLTDAERDELAACYERASVGADGPHDETVRLLTRSFSRRDTIPEYYRYTSLHVFDWYLRQHPDDTDRAALVALHVTLSDLARVESREAGRVWRPSAETSERLHRLRTLITRVRRIVTDPGSGETVQDLVRGEFVTDSARRRRFLLSRCSGFRQSDKHDEHIFLRCVQACELVFFLVRQTAHRVVDAVGADPPLAGERLRRLGTYADLLNDIFHLLRTLTPTMFMGFREATGAASAVQSLNYHLMELVVYGHDPRKAETYDRFPHLAVLNAPALRGRRALVDVVEETGDPALRSLLDDSTRALLTWRGRHYGFGRRYLADIKGSGGTDGASYLKRYVDKTRYARTGDRTEHHDLLVDFACR
ncbi:hypothetical protein GCM10009557_63120 [Virgisporangium ochraceum]|uniref:Tryptophan 2,3-dioxygenase n=1 Tax=Virgisporangium ochraceum TaxID=65505 RepID=A0A8J4A0Y5_9ACTN|nr:tryptophan 2,3-dioxygenase family protein [Virgisporangium ochraceum]GIJ73834.1 hypothetical protein Voc01_087510 [Virgisporangium ochraceum]